MQQANDIESEARRRIGLTLRGKYRLERLLGVGGMAAVYAASHRNGRAVAVKLLHAELSVNAAVRERFLREGLAANAVRHPGAVAVLDDDITEDGVAFLVMELLEGASVEALCEKLGGTLPLEAVAAIGCELLAVLAAAHEGGLVHRDIKPANLFITREGVLKVLDFGIARLRDGTGAHATHTGVMLGTPAFMAPEQALGRTTAVDARTDLFAVGATLFVLASGRDLHDAESAQEMLVKMATLPAPSLASVLPTAPPELARVVDRALAFEQSARWNSAAAMREALATALPAGTANPAATLASLVREVEVRAAMRDAHAPSAGVSAAPPLGGEPAFETQLVTASPARGTPGPSAAKRRLAVAVLVAAGALAAVTWWRRSPPAADDKNGALKAAPAATSEQPAASSSPAPVVSPVGTETGPAPLAESAPRPSGAPRPNAPAHAADAPRRSVPAKDAKTPATPKPTEPNPLEPARTRSDCTPPYTVDASGFKHWKRECL